jgi:DNA mismatch endonuclease (patch repair protein)
MADVFTKEQRSMVMRHVKSSRNKSTELKLIKFFKANQITGWRRNYPLLGKPDFTFPKTKITVFVDGCFWHGHNCRNTVPKDNADYWSKKIERNKNRDSEVGKALEEKGWSVIRFWECELKNEELVKGKLQTTSGLAKLGLK